MTEVTDAMKKAGADMLEKWDRESEGWEGDGAMCEQIYLAMEAKRIEESAK